MVALQVIRRGLLGGSLSLAQNVSGVLGVVVVLGGAFGRPSRTPLAASDAVNAPRVQVR